ncbi:hypothetical protein Tco_0197399, partial [Tanacetum coccineum]
ILDAMPWRHTDTDLRDDFPTHYNENDAACLAEFVVPLRPPPRHLLYGDPIPADQRPKIRTTPPLAVGEPIPKNLEKPNSKIVAAREKKDQQNLAKAQAKRAGEGGSEARRKKRRVRKNQEPDRSGSERTLSPTPLNQAV